ncbi:MAG: RNA methyltransferase [Polyangia bacterium]
MSAAANNLPNARLAARTYLALVHYPVYDKNHLIVSTSITNLDIHDIARSARTYGVNGYYLVHPVAAQRELAGRILGHWQHGDGQEQNDFRKEALSLVRIASSVEEVVDEISKSHGLPPLVVATSAARRAEALSEKELIADPELQERPLLLLFGTGWGLAAQLDAQIARWLRPLASLSSYNHLSVRSAAGIFLDRLFGEPGELSHE